MRAHRRRVFAQRPRSSPSPACHRPAAITASSGVQVPGSDCPGPCRRSRCDSASRPLELPGMGYPAARSPAFSTWRPSTKRCGTARIRSGCRSHGPARQASTAIRGNRPPAAPARHCRAPRRARRRHQRPDRAEGQKRLTRLHPLGQAQVDQAVIQQTADQELHRQVIDPLGVRIVGCADRFEPAIDDLVANRIAERHPPIVELRMGGVLRQRIGQVTQHRIAQVLGGHGQIVRHRQIGLCKSGFGGEYRCAGPRGQAAHRCRRW
jgi:hypothetical protein